MCFCFSDPEIYRGTWTAEEDAHLRDAVDRIGVGKWAQIAKVLYPPRTDYQIRKRWYIISRSDMPASAHSPTDGTSDESSALGDAAGSPAQVKEESMLDGGAGFGISAIH
jgi:hypothetical protein